MSDTSEPSTSASSSSKTPWWRTVSGKFMALLAFIATIATIITAIPIVFPPQPPKPPAPPMTELQRTPHLALEFWNGTPNGQYQYPMTSEDFTKYNQKYATLVHVAAKRAPFEIRFPTLNEDSGGGLQICAWTDDSIFVLSDGFNFKDTSKANEAAFKSPFVPGKGLVNTESGNAELPITDKYISYWSQGRVEHISETKDKVFLSRGVSRESSELFSNWTKPLYLAIWIDTDLDLSIDVGEYEYIVIDFTA